MRPLRWLPPVVIQSSESALDEVSIRPYSERFRLQILLKPPHGPITELHQPLLKDLDSGLELLRLLQGSKAGNLTVDSFDRYLCSGQTRLSRQDIQACESSHILTVVKECTMCTIRHWNNIKP